GSALYSTILPATSTLEFLISTVGADHVLLGSDYPFDMGNLDCVARVEALAIAPRDRELIVGGYARRLLDAPEQPDVAAKIRRNGPAGLRGRTGPQQSRH